VKTKSRAGCSQPRPVEVAQVLRSCLKQTRHAGIAQRQADPGRSAGGPIPEQLRSHSGPLASRGKDCLCGIGGQHSRISRRVVEGPFGRGLRIGQVDQGESHEAFLVRRRVGEVQRPIEGLDPDRLVVPFVDLRYVVPEIGCACQAGRRLAGGQRELKLDPFRHEVRGRRQRLDARLAHKRAGRVRAGMACDIRIARRKRADVVNANREGAPPRVESDVPCRYCQVRSRRRDRHSRRKRPDPHCVHGSGREVELDLLPAVAHSEGHGFGDRFRVTPQARRRPCVQDVFAFGIQSPEPEPHAPAVVLEQVERGPQ